MNNSLKSIKLIDLFAIYILFMIYTIPIENISTYGIQTLTVLIIFMLILMRKLRIFTIDLLLIISCLYLFINAALTGWSYNSYRFALYYFLGTLLIILFLKIKFNFKMLFNFAVLFATILALFTIYQYLFPNSFSNILNFLYSSGHAATFIENQSLGRFGGLCGYPGMNSCLISFGVGILFANFEKYKGRKILVLLVMGFAIMLTGSRSILIATLIAGMVSYVAISETQKNLLKKAPNRFVKLFKYIAVVGIVVVILLLILPSVTIALQRLLEVSDTDSSLVTRQRLWEYAIHLFNQSPVIGTGINSFLSLTSLDTSLVDSYAHNVYLQLLAEIGMIGFVCVLAPIVYSFGITLKAAIKNICSREDAFILRAALYIQIIFFIYSFSGNPFYDDHLRLMVMFASVFSANYIKKNIKINKPEYMKLENAKLIRE